MPVPKEVASIDIPWHEMLCQGRKKFIEEALQPHILVRECRSVMRKYHAMALKCGCYLEITETLRSMSNEDAQSDERTALIKKMLMDMQSLGNHIDLHRYSPCLLRGEHGTVDVDGSVNLDAAVPRRKKTQTWINWY
jgi:hypothetical protein